MDRNYYLDKLVRKIGNGRIKVISGIKGCGKTYLLLNSFYRWLLENGIKDENIIIVELENFDYGDIKESALNLYLDIKSRITNSEKHFILIDEIQHFNGFESLLNELNNNKHDVYITGSNSMILSKEISTHLRGRDDQMKMYPLTFKEVYKGTDKFLEFNEYVKYGGLPYIQELENDSEKEDYLKSFFREVYIKDIMKRHQILRVDVLDSLINFMSSSIGSFINMKQIEEAFKAEHIKVTDQTISKYISYLLKIFVFEKPLRYDINRKEYLSYLDMYYAVDVGLRNARLKFREEDPKYLLKNIVYLELISRGYIVDVGVIKSVDKKQLEIDFIARRGDKQYFIQCAYMLPTIEEIIIVARPLTRLKNGFKKIILTYDPAPFSLLEEGYERLNVIDFLLDVNFLN